MSCVCLSAILQIHSNLCERYIQVNFAEHIRQLKILGSCPVTVKYRVTALYRDVIYSFDRTCKDKKVPNRFFGIRDLPYLKARIGILKL